MKHPNPVGTHDSRFFFDAKCKIARTVSNTYKITFSDEDVVELKNEESRNLERRLGERWSKDMSICVKYTLVAKKQKTEVLVLKRN